MSSLLEYCAVRKELEEKSWSAVERYSSAGLRLLKLVGQRSHSEFLTAHCECFEAKAVVSHMRSALTTHRTAHGC